VRRLVPTSLTARLITMAVALVAVVCLLIAAATTLVLRSYLIDRLDGDVQRSLERVQMLVHGDVTPPTGGPSDTGPGSFGQTDGGEPPPTPLGNRENSLNALISSNGTGTGTAVTTDGDRRELDAIEVASLAEVEPGHDPETIDVADLGSFRVAAVDVGGGTTLVQGIPTADVDGTIRTLIWWETGLGVAGVGAAAIAGRGLIRRQLRPLRSVAETAERVTQLDLASGEVGRTERVPTELTDPDTEVGQVGEALNRLLGHVEDALDARHESEQQARQFLADASHELRTPLATIKGYAELSRRIDDPDELTGVLGKVDSESQRMTRLVEDMLMLARLDAGREFVARPVDLSRLVTEAVHDAAVVDPERAWGVDLPTEPVTISGDEQRLHQLVTNLLRNATRHTPAGTRVETSLQVDRDTVVLTVADNGTDGIDPALLPTIFDRFTRGDASRTRASGGAGLGTSLVRAIAHAHGGTAAVTSSPGDTRFVVTLPRR